MKQTTERFNLLARLLHWLMALLVLFTLFVGVGMMSTVSPLYRQLLGVHRTVGIVVLALVAVRLINRLLRGVPPLPPDLPRWQRAAAYGSHIALYLFMIAIPLLGWAMLSAASYPVVIFGSIQLPPITSQSDSLFTVLHATHVWLAYLLFVVWLIHFGAALFHRFVRRDGVLQSML